MTFHQTILSTVFIWVIANQLYAAEYKFIDKDSSQYIEYLGNPYYQSYNEDDQIYARNIWDMQIYKNKVYLGAGNSSNIGPASNAGPVNIISYDLQSEIFETEYRVDDEQIDHFYVFNDSLYVPGHDPTQSWSWGNFYRKDNIDAAWEKIRNIPKGIHNYDMAWYNGKLLAALGTEDGAAIAVSDDFGKNWNKINIGSSRAYTLAIVGEQLYAIKTIRTPNYQEKYNYSNVYRYEFNTEKMMAVNKASIEFLFPDTDFDEKKYGKIVRATSINDKNIYIGAYKHNDHQYLPFGVYLAKSESIMSLNLPDNLSPWDILVKGGYVAILASELNSNNQFTNHVFVSSSDDLKNWQEILTFQYRAFARSFEYYNGDFYFGMGTEIEDPDNWTINELKEESGDILRLMQQYWDQ